MERGFGGRRLHPFRGWVRAPRDRRAHAGISRRMAADHFSRSLLGGGALHARMDGLPGSMGLEVRPIDSETR